jgi:(p)ppGpp synthase/HD superfamily hydrolase
MNRDLDGAEPNSTALGERFERALRFAAETHRPQRRKGSGIPYVGHLLGVCSLVIEDGGDEDEAIAALLHDAPEDQGGAAMLETIRAEFGVKVAEIVEACSDTLEEKKPKWRARKEAYLEHLDGQPAYVLRVSLADKLFNVRSIIRDLRAVGDEVWERFKAGRDGQLWYYRGLADRFGVLLPGQMATELSEAVADLERLALAPTDG